MKKNTLITVTAAMLLSALLLSLAGCGGKTAAANPGDGAGSSGQGGSSEAEAVPGRQNGERFESVIIMEGMEETVKYEHIRNDSLGFEMDYDYELFERLGGSDRERFVSRYDDPYDPENYLEVGRIPRDAETAAAAVSAVLSLDYEISRDDSFPLERAGSCIRIDASVEKGGLNMPEHLRAVYIIPAADGCRVAAAHYSIESAEGFGRRFRCFMDTFSVIAGSGETRITADRAVSAIMRYCMLGNPDLAGIVGSGEYPAYWDISSVGENEIVVLFRSYTGAENRYYIDPVSGQTYVTERVPGIIDEERRTEESLNAWDYLF